MTLVNSGKPFPSGKDEEKHGSTGAVSGVREVATSEQRANETTSSSEVQEDDKPHRGLRYWLIILSLSITGLLPALESTVLSTALPTIVEELGGNEFFVWAANAYFVATIATTPLYSQMADVWGRRRLIVVCVSFFILGSGVAGGAQNIYMLIAGRALQGAGGGGISMLVNLIVCDLTPLRQRGSILAIIFAAVTLGTSLGPVLGGVVVHFGDWRWAFYLNLPIGASSLVLLVTFLRVKYDQQSTLSEKIRRIDFGGNILFILSIVSITFALINGGAIHPWSSYKTVVPLVLGILGLGLFAAYEHLFAVEPIVPPRLFTSSRTSTIAFVLTFIHTLLMYTEIYFLPVYFQSTLLTSALGAGVHLLPSVILLMVFGAVGGRLMQRTGNYQWLHAAGFALTTLAFGLFTTLNHQSNAAAWVLLQVVFAAGMGLAMGTLLPAAQAELQESDAALATGVWSTMRNFGTIAAVTVAAAIFDNRTAQLASTGLISETPAAHDQLVAGRAYEHATADFVLEFAAQPQLQAEIVSAFASGLNLVWSITAGLAGLSLLLVAFEKKVELRTKLKTEFGLDKKGETNEQIKA